MLAGEFKEQFEQLNTAGQTAKGAGHFPGVDNPPAYTNAVRAIMRQINR